MTCTDLWFSYLYQLWAFNAVIVLFGISAWNLNNAVHLFFVVPVMLDIIPSNYIYIFMYNAYNLDYKIEDLNKDRVKYNTAQ